MARSGKVTVTSQDLQGYDGNDLQVAISIWGARYGPATYNQWQSAYFTLRREYGCIDPGAVQGETYAAQQGRMRKMWKDLQVESFGEDHLARAFALQRTEAVGEVRGPEEPGSPQEGGPAGERDLEGPGAQDRVELHPVVPYQNFDVSTPGEEAYELSLIHI